MKIIGRLGEYNVYATQSGWSYCTVTIYKDFRFLYFNFKKKVYESETGITGGVMRSWEVKKLRKDQFEKWFTVVVEEYENIVESFTKEALK